MKRRGFLGFMGGAAVAGPSAAKAAISQMPAGMELSANLPPIPPIGGYMATTAANDVDNSWKISEIANIKKFLSGDLSEDEKEQRHRQRMYGMHSIISQHVAGLRSVSGVQKFAMYNRAIEAKNDEISRSEARGRLHWLMRG